MLQECWCHLCMVFVVIVSNWPLGSEYVATAKVGNQFRWLTIRNGCSLHFYEEEGCELVPNLLPPVLWEMFTKSGLFFSYVRALSSPIANVVQ